MLEPPRTSALAPSTPCFPCKAVVRESSVESKNSTHLAVSARMWFEKVRGGSMCLNHPELVHKHPAHLASPVKIKIQARQTSSNLFEPHYCRDGKVCRVL